MSSPSWIGRYINLDRSSDRRAAIEAELRKAKLRPAYQRLRAVDGRKLVANGKLTAAEIACFKSHAAALGESDRARWLHILEDDVILARSFGPVVQSLITAGALQAYDLVFTDIIIAAPHIITIRNLKNNYDKAMAEAPDINFSILDLNNSNFLGANSYFVNPNSLEKLQGIVDAELGADAPGVAIDSLYSHLVHQRQLRAGCVFPFLSHVSLAGTSTIRGTLSTLELAHDLLRAIFSVECDLEELKSIAAVLSIERGNPHLVRAVRGAGPHAYRMTSDSNKMAL